MSYCVVTIEKSQLLLAIQTLKDKGYKLSASKRLHELLAKDFRCLFGGIIHSESIKVIKPRGRKVNAMSLHEVLALAGVPPQVIRENQ